MSSTGLLKNQSFMNNLKFIDVDYCRFSDWGYKKPTRIWYGCFRGAVRPGPPLRDMKCLGVGRCLNMRGNRHIFSLCTRPDRKAPSKNKKYRVPAKLVQYLMFLWLVCLSVENKKP